MRSRGEADDGAREGWGMMGLEYLLSLLYLRRLSHGRTPKNCKAGDVDAMLRFNLERESN
jgi:hypothetical protein